MSKGYGAGAPPPAGMRFSIPKTAYDYEGPCNEQTYAARVQGLGAPGKIRVPEVPGARFRRKLVYLAHIWDPEREAAEASLR